MNFFQFLCRAGLLFFIGAGAVHAAAFISLDPAAARQLVAPARVAQPTVLALWSADCPHCKKNLATFARLARANPALRVLTVAAEPEHAALAPILDRLHLPGARYAYGSASPEALAYALDPDWRGELPRTLLFDGRGGLVKHSGEVTEAQVEAATGLRFGAAR